MWKKADGCGWNHQRTRDSSEVIFIVCFNIPSVDKSFPNLTAKVQAATASLDPLSAGSLMQDLGQCGIECSLKGDVLWSWIMWEAFSHVGNSKIHSCCKKFCVQENANADVADPKKNLVQWNFFFCIKYGEGCDIFKNFLNMLINHKINEAKSGRKTLPSCAKLFAVRVQLLWNLCRYSSILERWENAWFIWQ